ncbi:Cupin domain-containing protein [Parafrankia irregularis]|uniref:Cupin domain-containing protein n=1 Tax=Parafrankia irregularis TaxID=795642 RepID=A0A0S4QT40_9ACTN|nr:MULTISPECIES: cupin domain-containing protein [Parafrankia]MBE3205860.1 cupin domain-containing protein [Parafrankia sp. CH37]CUU58194.1 Cupin domain-containing protein [Parafrankia irregularis]
MRPFHTTSGTAGGGPRTVPPGRPAPVPLATAATTGGSYGLLRVRLLPADEAPYLIHHGEDRSFVVLDGRMRVEAASRHFTAATGDLVFVPRDRPHRCLALDGPADVLMLFTPGGAEGLYLALWPPGHDADLIAPLSAEYNVDVLVQSGEAPDEPGSG